MPTTPSSLDGRRRSAGQVDELRQNGALRHTGRTGDEAGEFADCGAARMYLQTLDLTDLDHLALIGEEVLPGVSVR